MNTTKINQVTNSVLVCVISIFWLGVVWRLLDYSENYIGINFYYVVFLCVFLFFTSWVAFKNDHGAMAKYGLVYAVISILGLAFLYFGNILLPYEIWLEKGMPERLFF